MKLEHFATKKDGKFTITQRKTFEEGLSLLPDGNYTVIVEKRKKKRSLSQNNYYFLLVAMIRDRLIDLGHDVDSETTHEMLKGRLLYSEMIDENSGEIIKIPRSTKKLGTSEFMDYIEDVKRFSAEVIGLVLPDPNDQIEIDV
jgi:hypothetical protein